MLKEVQRILAPGGLYLAISYGDPPNRIPLFERAHLSFDVKCLVIQYPANASEDGQSSHSKSEDGNDQSEPEAEVESLLKQGHYCYICIKKEDSEVIAKQNWPKVKRSIEQHETSSQTEEYEGHEELDESRLRNLLEQEWDKHRNTKQTSKKGPPISSQTHNLTDSRRKRKEQIQHKTQAAIKSGTEMPAKPGK